MSTFEKLIQSGMDSMNSDNLLESEKSLAAALKQAESDEERFQAVRSLLNLAGKFLKNKDQEQPKTLYDYIKSAEISERTKVMEWLASLYKQMDDLEGAERIYVEIYDLRVEQLGPNHPDTTGVLQTAAMLVQMQGKSPEDLYARALNAAKEAIAKPSNPQLGDPTVTTRFESIVLDKNGEFRSGKSAKKAKTDLEELKSSDALAGIDSELLSIIQNEANKDAKLSRNVNEGVALAKLGFELARRGHELAEQGAAISEQGLALCQSQGNRDKDIAQAQEQSRVAIESLVAASQQLKQAMDKLKEAEQTKLAQSTGTGRDEQKDASGQTQGQFQAELNEFNMSVEQNPEVQTTGVSSASPIVALSLLDDLLQAKKPDERDQTSQYENADGQERELEKLTENALGMDGETLTPATNASPGNKAAENKIVFNITQSNKIPGASPFTTQSNKLPLGKSPTQSNKLPGGNSPSTTQNNKVVGGKTPSTTQNNKVAGGKSPSTSQSNKLPEPPLDDSAFQQTEDDLEYFNFGQPSEQPYEQETASSSMSLLETSWEAVCNPLSTRIEEYSKVPADPPTRELIAQIQALFEKARSAMQGANVDVIFERLKEERWEEGLNLRIHQLDREIQNELRKIYFTWNGSAITAPYEVCTAYGWIRRTIDLGPLHQDSLRALLRLSLAFTEPQKPNYRPDIALQGLSFVRSCSENHPNIKLLDKIRNDRVIARCLLRMGNPKESLVLFNLAYRAAKICEDLDPSEMVSLLKEFASCHEHMENYASAAEFYERIRRIQEAMARNSEELYGTIIHLMANYRKLDNVGEAQSCHQRIVCEMDWLDDPTSMRLFAAQKCHDLKQWDLAEQLCKDVLSQAAGDEGNSRKAMIILCKVYEGSGRRSEAMKLKEVISRR